jgi:DNA repair exonuclease SbcCD ATPase subunit
MLNPDPKPLGITYANYSTNDTRLGYRLRLFRFREIGSLEINLPPDGIILLDGRSGIGKSSILEAISFVLHDDAGNTCYPRKEKANKKKNASTLVELTFPNGLIIYRQRRPNLLRVLGPDIDLMDDSAECYIDRLFGSLNNWLVGGYIRQTELCAFFTLSSDDKLNLLRKINLKYTEKIELELVKTSEKIALASRQNKEIEIQIKVYSEMYMRLYNQCTEEVKSKQLWSPEKSIEYFTKYQVVNYNDLLTKIKLESYSKSQSIRSEISNIQIQIAQFKENIKQRIRIEDIIKENTNELLKYSDDYSLDIIQGEKDLTDIIEQITISQKTERRVQLLSAKTEIQRQLELISSEISKYTWNELDRYEKVLSGPTLDQIEEHLTEIVLAKDYQDKLEKYQKYQSVLNQVKNLQTQLETYPKHSVSDQIEDINKKIWNLNLQQKKLTCPQCSSSLQLNNGKLDLMEINEEHLECLSLNELNLEKFKYQDIESRYQQRNHIERSLTLTQQQLSLLQYVDLPTKPKLADYNSFQLDGLKNQLIDAKRSRESLPDNLNIKDERNKITQQQERSRLNSDIDRISKELDGLIVKQDQPIEIRILETRRSEIVLKLSELRLQETRKNKLLATREQLINQLKSYPDNNIVDLEVKVIELQKDLESVVHESSELEKDISAQIQLKQLSEIYTQHDQYQKINQETIKYLAALQKIKASLITAEYIALDVVLSELNSTINKIIDSLFLESISVNIRSLRQLKTDDRIKPQINCQIIYDGAECSKITELSVGERIRVSIALAIAFSQFNNAPFFILDESLSTLDAVTKESTIKIIKHYLPNKLIIMVNHDTTVGVYNSVIHLS